MNTVHVISIPFLGLRKIGLIFIQFTILPSADIDTDHFAINFIIFSVEFKKFASHLFQFFLVDIWYKINEFNSRRWYIVQFRIVFIKLKEE